MEGGGDGAFFSYTLSVSPSVQLHSFTQKGLGNAGGAAKLFTQKQASKIQERKLGT